jgi:hypothetical protein
MAMKTIETIAVVNEEGHISLDISCKLIPGKHRVVIVIEDEITDVEEDDGSPLTDEEKDYFIQELKEIEENPNTGFTWEEVMEELEVEYGKKIPVNS